MRILALGDTLEEITQQQLEPGKSAAILANQTEALNAMELAGMFFEGEVNLKNVEFCKMETQQECLAGSLCIPRFSDLIGSRYKILFFINRSNIVIIDDDGFAERLVMRIRSRRTRQGQTREHFLYNFITQFISKDIEILGQYEKKIMELEEKVMNGKAEKLQSQIMPIRRELLILRSYYDEMMDMGKELEEDENHFFAKKQLKYFGTITDRADRLMGKTVHLLEYAQQVKDAQQAQIDAVQTKNMQFLTVISTIFFPLTLITGWYGMNFENMPELQNGYPFVIALSLVVVGVCIIIFKKKNIF